MFSQTLVFNEGSTDLSSDGEDEIQENATITQTKEILSPQTSGSKTQEPQSDSRSLILWAASLELESIGLKRNSSLLQKTLADSCDSLNKILRDIQKGLEKWNRLSSQTVQQSMVTSTVRKCGLKLTLQNSMQS
ncbi:unnamed protein product [Kuraishia capsulata CBS 1993]|uniref:Uncharacterized protein n=1 Tax=Kuraishia capsulata CBS 1993 TaxID=1382522 RepID=W6ML26_9ASCO|nr:uncharacterized protein KUCA_T00003141001 [Kuraishia capsulata CBS 1993]CDK27164.1 unnamed protein product [Kuraishia capsulata CBS 1993]